MEYVHVVCCKEKPSLTGDDTSGVNKSTMQEKKNFFLRDKLTLKTQNKKHYQEIKVNTYVIFASEFVKNPLKIHTMYQRY